MRVASLAVAISLQVRAAVPPIGEQHIDSPCIAREIQDVTRIVEQYWQFFHNYIQNASEAIGPSEHIAQDYWKNVSHAIVPQDTWSYFQNVSQAIYPREVRQFVYNITHQIFSDPPLKPIAPQEDKLAITKLHLKETNITMAANPTTFMTQHYFDELRTTTSNSSTNTADQPPSSSPMVRDSTPASTLHEPVLQTSLSIIDNNPPMIRINFRGANNHSDDTLTLKNQLALQGLFFGSPTSETKSSITPGTTPLPKPYLITASSSVSTVLSSSVSTVLSSPVSSPPIWELGANSHIIYIRPRSLTDNLTTTATAYEKSLLRRLTPISSVTLKLKLDEHNFLVTTAKVADRIVNLIVSTLSNKNWATLDADDFDTFVLPKHAKHITGAAGQQRTGHSGVEQMVSVSSLYGTQFSGAYASQAVALANDLIVPEVDFIVIDKSNLHSAIAEPASADGLLGLGIPITGGSLIDGLRSINKVSSPRMASFAAERVVIGDLGLSWEDLTTYTWAHSKSRNAWVIPGNLSIPKSYSTDISAVFDTGSPFFVVPRSQFISFMRHWIPSTLRPYCSLNNVTKLFQCPCGLLDTALPNITFTISTPLAVKRQLSTSFGEASFLFGRPPKNANWDIGPAPTITPQNIPLITKDFPSTTNSTTSSTTSSTTINSNNTDDMIEDFLDDERPSIHLSASSFVMGNHKKNKRHDNNMCSLLVVPGEEGTYQDTAWTFGVPAMLNLNVVFDPDSLIIGLQEVGTTPALETAEAEDSFLKALTSFGVFIPGEPDNNRVGFFWIALSGIAIGVALCFLIWRYTKQGTENRTQDYSLEDGLCETNYRPLDDMEEALAVRPVEPAEPPMQDN